MLVGRGLQGASQGLIKSLKGPTGEVSCTAVALCQRMGQPPEPQDISWPSSPIGTVSCAAEERKQRGGGGKVTEENLTTSTLTVGENHAIS